MAKFKCGDCEHWRISEWEDINNITDETLGECAAMEFTDLPHAWRYATREVVRVDFGEMSDCLRFDRRCKD